MISKEQKIPIFPVFIEKTGCVKINQCRFIHETILINLEANVKKYICLVINMYIKLKRTYILLFDYIV